MLEAGGSTFHAYRRALRTCAMDAEAVVFVL